MEILDDLQWLMILIFTWEINNSTFPNEMTKLFVSEHQDWIALGIRIGPTSILICFVLIVQGV